MLESREKNPQHLLINMLHWDHTKDCLLSPVDLQLVSKICKFMEARNGDMTSEPKYIMINYHRETGLDWLTFLLLMSSKCKSNIGEG